MGYSEKLEIVKNNIITKSNDRILHNWNRMFRMWLSCEGSMVFPDIYIDSFNDEFAQYIKPEIKTLLWLAGKNIVFAIGAYTSVNNDADLDDVLTFTKLFIEEQLDDFNNWCDDICMAMYEESSDYERENARENNPLNSGEREDNPQ